MTEYAVLRIRPGLHRQVKIAAALNEKTIKDWVEGVIEDALAGRPSASVLVDTRAGYSIDPRYDCHPDERDPSPSEIEARYLEIYGHLPGETDAQEENDA